MSSIIYSGAEWKPVGNHGGLMAEHLGLVVHRQEGDNSLYGWFNDPASEVSATWWAGMEGTVEQYVDAGTVAWAQAAGNGSYNSVETEGYVTAALTPAQVAAVAAIYRWGHEVYGWPFVLAEAPGQPGLGWHGMGGVAWGDHPDCPGDLVRAQLATILNLAQGSVITPNPAPNPTTINFPGDNMQIINESVLIENGEGWLPFPGDITAGSYVTTNILTTPVPAERALPVVTGISSAGWAGAPNGGIRFGVGPQGPAANGVYGVTVVGAS